MTRYNKNLLNILKDSKVLYKLNKNILSHKNLNINDTVLICGSPRSGTTWFEEMMINLLNYTYLHEPLHPGWYPESIDAGFNARSSYIPVGKQNKKAEEYLEKTFKGKTYSFLPNYNINPNLIMNYLSGDKLLVKSVRMNRLLPWITENFELKKIFLIIRHPCAVVSSQLKSSFIGYHSPNPPYDPMFPKTKNIIEDASNINELNQRIIKKLNGIKSKEEILAAAWCLDAYVPINYKDKKWTTIFYEDYVKSPKEIVNKIIDDNNFKIPKNFDIDNVNKPSMSVMEKNKKTVTKTDKQLSKWKKNLSEKQIKNILKVVSDFELNIYDEDITPHYNPLK